MKKAKNVSKKLIAILLSAAMTFTPMVQSMQVYAAEVETQNEIEDLGTMPEADELDDAVSDDGDAEEAAGEEQAPNDVDDDVSNDDSKDNTSDDEKDADTGKVEENTEEKTETKTEAKEDTEPKETVSDPVYEEVLEEESESVSGSEEESESEFEEMSQEEVRASFSNITVNDIKAGGWNESIYAEIPKVTDDSAITAVKYSGPTTGELKGQDLEFLVRTVEKNGTRIDILGLKPGTYELTIAVNGSGDLKKSGIEVYAYDRSGYAHFNYHDGVGAYNDDGTLKSNAKVIYVTPDTVNSVELTVGTTTVKGIGNILNTVGKACGEAGHDNQCKRVSKGKTYYGIANTNQGIIEKLSEANTPLVVRFIGTISESGLKEQAQYNANHDGLIDGLTAYNSDDYGGIPGDNGHMARIKSGKNITLEGIGYDAVIDGWGFHFMAESATADKGFGKGFEVRNLKFINTPEDAIGMEGIQESGKITAGVERCWIHNNEFYCPNIGSPAESDKAQGDGSVDFKRGMYFTCSYNYFEGCHKTNLVGSSDSSLQFNLTYHHNYWYMCEARGPLTRQANVHMYNNIFDMQTSYAMNTRANAYIFSEYNMFYACKSPHDVDSGAIKSYKDSISSVLWAGTKGTYVSSKDEYVPNSCQYLTTKYDKFDVESDKSYIPGNNTYQLQEDYKKLRQVIKSQTGVQAQNPKRPEAVTESEYSVVDRMAKTVNTFDKLPQDLTPGKISKSVYAFEVGTAFDLEITYADPAKAPGVLVNEEGANLLEGDGSVLELPAGKYMIQAVNFQPGKVSGGKVTSIAVFKDMTISSLKIKAHDPNAHYHNWKLDSTQSIDPTCTEEGKKVYTCTEGCPDAPKTEPIPALGHDWISSGTNAKNPTCTEAGEGNFKCSRCDATNSGTVPALGHSWGPWEVVTPATATTEGKEKRVCTRDETHFEEREIPKGGTGTGNPGITVAGNYELYFDHQNRTPLGDTDFFTVSGSYSGTKGSTTVNDTEYTSCLKMESSTNVSFSCNDEATLFMAFASTEANKSVKVDGTAYKTGSNGTVTVGPLSAGKHTITKGDSINLFYVSVDNGETSEVYYTLSFAYNYGEDVEEDEPEPKKIQVLAGSSYSTMTALVPVSFTRNGYNLKGLYKDTACTQAVTYPYVVNGDATFYAQWEEGETTPPTEEGKTYTLYFDTNGGSSFVPVSISKSEIYEITQKPTKTGYAFMGWYDALEGGKLVNIIDGSKLTNDITVYAHWNQLEAVKLSLDCSKLAAGDITGTTDLNGSGFIAHALPEGGGSDKESPKYYMTVKKDEGLYTNGVRLTDTSIPGNEDGLLKTIEFTTEGSGVLSVEMALSGKADAGKTYKLVLAKKSADGSLEKVSESAITTATAKTTKEFEIPAAGTYYLYAEGDKGIVYYNMKVIEQMYTIIWQVGNGTVSTDANIDSTTARKGDKIALPSKCTPASGYTFKGWSADDGTTLLNYPDVYEVKEEDATSGTIVIAAIYEAQEYKLKYENDANKGTLPEGMQSEVTVKTGDRITLENCTPAEGYQFVGWSLGRSTEVVTSPYTVNGADADDNMTITLTATYVKAGGNVEFCTVTLDTDGGTLLDGGGIKRQVLANTTIDPGKCEKVGYAFIGWTVDGKDIKTPYTVKGNVTLKAKYSFTAGAPTEGIYILGLEESYFYTGAKIIPDIEVWDYDIPEGKLLAQDVDYKVAYKNNVKVTEDIEDKTKWAEVIVTGKGNYAGKNTSQRFCIVEEKTVTENFLEIKGAKIGRIDNMEYTGEAQYPKFELTLKGESPVWYEYDKSKKQYVVADEGDNKGTTIAANVAVSNNVNKGTATILVTGAKDENGKVASVKKTFKITAIDLSKANVTVDPIAPVEYVVNGAVPASIKVTVTSEGKTHTLKQGKDYTVKYGKNKTATTEGAEATVTITGKGNYTKKYPNPIPYAISPLNMSELEVSAVTVCEGVKPSKIKATVVDKNGTALKASQYTIKVYETEDAENELSDEALEAGDTIYVAAEAKDTKNLTGTTERQDFTVGKDFSKAKVVLARDEVSGKVITKSYTGSPVTLDDDDIIVTYPGVEEPLEVGIDYEIVEYINNTKKGTATAVIRGNYDYSGTKTVKFKILGKSMEIEEATPWDKVSWMIQNFKSRFSK